MSCFKKIISVILFCCLVWLPYNVKAEPDPSTKIESLEIGVTASDKSGNSNYGKPQKNPALEKTIGVTRYQATLLHDNIYYVDLGEEARNRLFILGERASETATVQIEDMADLADAGNFNYEAALTFTPPAGWVGETPKNPFITTGKTAAKRHLQLHLGASCYRITVTDGGMADVYYLVVKNNAMTYKDGKFINYLDKAVPYSPESIMLCDAKSGAVLDEPYQFFENDLFVSVDQGNVLPENIPSVRLKLKNETEKPAYSYFEHLQSNNSAGTEPFYRMNNNYISLNGGGWTRLDGDGTGLSQELVLKKGWNTILLRNCTEAQISMVPGADKYPAFGVSVLMVYRGQDNSYRHEAGADYSLRPVRAYRVDKRNNYWEDSELRPFNEFEIQETGGKRYIRMSSAENKLMLMVSPQDAAAKVTVGNATENIGGCYVLSVSEDTYNMNSPIQISAVAENGKQDNDNYQELYIDWIQGNAIINDIKVEGASLKSPFQPRLTTYALTDVKDTITFTLSLPDSVELDTALADDKEITVPDTLSFTVSKDTKNLAISVLADQEGLVSRRTYYFTQQFVKEGKTPTAQAEKMLQGVWEKYQEECSGKKYSDSYWETFKITAMGKDLKDALLYDVEKHPFKQGTDYAAVILELIMAGENPYNYRGHDYVSELQNEGKKGNGSYGPFACDIWALLALDAAGAEYDDSLIESVRTQTINNTVDMQGWAMAAVCNHRDYPGVNDALIKGAQRLRTESYVNEGELAGNIYDRTYGINVNTLSCAISGLVTANFDITDDYWKAEGKTPIDALEKYYIDGEFYYKISNNPSYAIPSLDKDAIIALGDICAGSNVWQRQILTGGKMAELLATAEKEYAKLPDSSSDKEGLRKAIDTARGAASEKYFGKEYFALQEALYAAVPSLKTRSFFCTEKQREQVLDLEEQIRSFRPGDFEAVYAAKAAYDALGSEDADLKEKLQSYVLDKKKLEIAYEIAKFEEKLAALGNIDELTEDQKDAVDDLLAIYEELTEEEKAAMPKEDIQKLNQAADRIVALAAEAVKTQIDALPTQLTLADEQVVAKARADYNALSKEQKALVPVDDVLRLKEAEETMNALKNSAAAETVARMITALGGEPSAEAVQAASAAYNALTKEQKALIDYDVVAGLKAAEQKLGIVISTVTLDKTTLEMVQNETAYLAAKVTGGTHADGTVTWTSSDPKVATVDGNGVVTSFRDGTAVITAAAQDGAKAACTVTVASELAAKATQTTSTVTLAWKTIPGAKGYVVSRYDKKSKKYKEIAALSSSRSEYTVKRVNGKSGEKLRTGTAYTFKVQAYVLDGKKKVYKQAETIKTATKPAKAALHKLTKRSATKVKLSWKKTAGASGYEIYMATSRNGEYTLARTIAKAKTTSYTKGGLKKGKTYYFKVRAYKTADGKKIKGAFSGIKKIKLK